MVAGNWKMHKTAGEAAILVQKLEETARAYKGKVEVVVAPPFTALHSVSVAIMFDKIPVGLAAQNLFWEDAGAYTGEVSAPMLSDLSCSYVIVGHSERREYFHETDADINRKINAASGRGIAPILCCGEDAQTRESGEALPFVAAQIRAGLRGLSPDRLAGLTIAYEPIWAIGSGKTATPQTAGEVCEHIRQVLADSYDERFAAATRILYGGSVKAENAGAFFAHPEIDGALVGGAALSCEAFAPIVKAAASV
jgi:triosephosphate isomerase